MSKFSNKALLVLLVALGVVIAAVKYFDSKKGERNFRSELVTLDSAKVSEILIYPKSKKGEEVKLSKDGAQWKVKINDTKTQRVDSAQITALFKTILGIKPSRLAARSADKWKDFEVDTSGSHVIVKEGNKTALDIIIGKFNVSGGRDVETYVRLSGENETYAVNGFLEGTFNGGIDAYRDKSVVKGNKESWTKLAFSLADTTRYSLEKRDSVWLVDGSVPANTEGVNAYLTQLASLHAAAFADDADANSLTIPQNILQLDDTLGNKIKVEGFAQGAKKIIRTSANPDNLLSGDGIWEQLFRDKSGFAPAGTAAAQ